MEAQTIKGTSGACTGTSGPRLCWRCPEHRDDGGDVAAAGRNDEGQECPQRRTGQHQPYTAWCQYLRVFAAQRRRPRRPPVLRCWPAHTHPRRQDNGGAWIISRRDAATAVEVASSLMTLVKELCPGRIFAWLGTIVILSLISSCSTRGPLPVGRGLDGGQQVGRRREQGPG